MRVKVKKLAIEKKYKIEYILNDSFEESDGVKIGDIFTVFGLRAKEDIVYVYILWDDNHLIEVPIELFEIVSGKISKYWKAKIWDDGEFTLWPELFYDPNFLENHAEREKKEREEFATLRGEMEEEANKNV